MNKLKNFLINRIQKYDEQNVSEKIPQEIREKTTFFHFISMCLLLVVVVETMGGVYIKNNMNHFLSVLIPTLLSTVVAVTILRVYILVLFSQYETERNRQLVSSLESSLSPIVSSVFVSNDKITLMMAGNKTLAVPRGLEVKTMNDVKTYLKTITI